MKPYNDYTPKISDKPESPEQVISVDPTVGRNASSRKTSTRERKTRERTSKRETNTDKTNSERKQSIWKAQTWRNFAANNTVRLITGVFLACMGVYLSVAFVSYLTNCIADQASIAHSDFGNAANIRNSAGEGGARLSDFLINNSFGAGSIVILFWLFAMAFKLFDSRLRFKTVNFTIKCLVALIAISLVVGLVTVGMNNTVNWGGLHGREVNEFIIHMAGWTGAAILSIFMIAVFVILCLNDLIKWIVRLRRAAAKRRAAAEKRRAADEQKRRMIAEMAEKEDHDASITGEGAGKDEEAHVEPERAVTFGEEEVALTYPDANEDKSDEQILPDEDNMTYGEIEDVDDIVPEQIVDQVSTPESEKEDEVVSEDENDDLSPMIVHKNHISETDAEAPAVPHFRKGEYPWQFPAYNLLLDRGPVVGVDHEEQLENQERIRKTLADFGINIVSIEATVGPTVTLYEIVPETGVKISKIRSLVDDIALSLSAVGVRIIAPIPGRGTVGIEVANKNPQTVSMRTVIKSKAFRETRYRLPIALGSTIGGEVYMADLAKMPHLLVAGATGQGKSVGLNVIITSLLYSRRPEELKFVMIDPKMVEFSLYAKIEKHYLAKLSNAEDPIVTEIADVAPTLSSLCVEMGDRYKLLKKAGVRQIEEYNHKIHNNQLDHNEGHRFLPYIVIIVDEFSDLIMQSGKEVETPIARLAQKARAVGMHVIIATQRPSTNVITGVIKGNFPARIAFKVASGVDSKTILDTPGAQSLIGRGDMLVSNNSEMVRVQCAFVDTPEVEAICDYIEDQPYSQGVYILPEPIIGAEDDNGSSYDSLNERDPLFEEVGRWIVNSRTASTSAIQRRYKIGYNRAGRIMDQLEKSGVVGPAHGGKVRSVLVDDITLESILSGN